MTGIDRFIAGVTALGLKCELRGALVIVTIDDVAPPGREGEHVVAADPPPNFPAAAPHWLHLPRELTLPEGGPQPSELGSEWLKWSRPHPRWRGGGNPARDWVSHARSLLLMARAA